MFNNKLSFSKVLVILLIAVLIAFAAYSVKVIKDFAALFDDDCLSEDEIVEVVKNNYQIFLDDVAENDFSDSERVKEIQKATVVGDAVDFDCGGKGFGPVQAISVSITLPTISRETFGREWCLVILKI